MDLPDKEERNLFTIFEKEFGRPLSPMELETISGWVDADRYPDELILLALKEAVFAGKLHFRYKFIILPRQPGKMEGWNHA